MSAETMDWLNNNTLIGFTEKRGKAWHYRAGSDNHFPGAIPVETVRERLFGWEAVEAPIFAQLSNGARTRAMAHKAITRSDTGEVLGVVGHKYQVHGYDQWLIKNVESILDSDVQIGSAGLLRGGSLAWVQVEVDETMSKAGVQFRPQLTAVTSLDRSCATTYRRNVQVVVCDNTLTAALGEKGPVARITHSSKSLARLSEIRNTLEIIHTIGEDFMAELEKLTNQKVSQAKFTRWVDAYCGIAGKPKEDVKGMARTKAAKLIDLWDNDDRVNPWKGTAYGVLAAANTYIHHEGIVRNGHRAERNWERVALGRVAAADTEALALLATV